MRLYPLALMLVLTGCGGRVVVDSYDLNAEPCSEIEARAYDRSRTAGAFGPAVEDLAALSTWVGGGVEASEEVRVSSVLVGLADGYGCEVPAQLEVAAWIGEGFAPLPEPGADATSYPTTAAPRARVAEGLVELALDLPEPIEARAGERVFVAVRLASGLTCAVAASGDGGWRWRPGVGWEALADENVAIGVGVVGVEGCE